MNTKLQPPFISLAGSLFFVYCAIYFCCTPAWAKNVETHRLFHFPRGYSIGKLILLNEPVRNDTFSCDGKFLTQCQGDVQVPTGKAFKFEPTGKFFQNPQSLLQLPPNAFESISLQFMPMFDEEDHLADAVMPYLHHLSSLKNIAMNKFEITNKGLAALGTMPELQVLTLSNTTLSGGCLASLVGSKKLHCLRVGELAIADEDVRCLKAFPLLQRLDLYAVKLTLKQLEFVVQCKTIRHLSLVSNPEITDTAIPMILKLPKLDTLNIKRSNITVNGLELIGKHALKEIFLPKDFVAYSPAEQRRIEKAFPRCFFSRQNSRQVDSDTKVIFGPVTR